MYVHMINHLACWVFDQLTDHDLQKLRVCKLWDMLHAAEFIMGRGFDGLGINRHFQLDCAP